MYGWAWALRLGLELRSLSDEQGQKWAKAYLPVEEAILANAKAYLPKLDWPIRCGFHPSPPSPSAKCSTGPAPPVTSPSNPSS